MLPLKTPYYRGGTGSDDDRRVTVAENPVGYRPYISPLPGERMQQSQSNDGTSHSTSDLRARSGTIVAFRSRSRDRWNGRRLTWEWAREELGMGIFLPLSLPPSLPLPSSQCASLIGTMETLHGFVKHRVFMNTNKEGN